MASAVSGPMPRHRPGARLSGFRGAPSAAARRGPPARCQEKSRERAEAPRLEPPGARGADEPSERGSGRRSQPPGRKPPRSAEIAYGPRDAGPGGMLGKDGAHGDFEAAPRRPPVLRAVAGVQRRVEAQETAGADSHGRLDDGSWAWDSGPRSPSPWRDRRPRPSTCRSTSPRPRAISPTRSSRSRSRSSAPSATPRRRWREAAPISPPPRSDAAYRLGHVKGTPPPLFFGLTAARAGRRSSSLRTTRTPSALPLSCAASRWACRASARRSRRCSPPSSSRAGVKIHQVPLRSFSNRALDGALAQGEVAAGVMADPWVTPHGRGAARARSWWICGSRADAARWLGAETVHAGPLRPGRPKSGGASELAALARALLRAVARVTEAPAESLARRAARHR